MISLGHFMAAFKETSVSRISEYVQFVEDMGLAHCAWYRGVGSPSYRLVPSLYRHKDSGDVDKLHLLELEVYEWFIQRGRIFVDRNILEGSDAIFLMQHYRIPTRLLDWSENPFVALYFALNSCVYNDSGSAVVWILNPAVWNSNALSLLKERIPYYEDDALNGFRIDMSKKTMIAAEKPVAIYGVHNNQRIMAQRGVFTVFGRLVQPMEESYAGFPEGKDCLQRVIISRDYVSSMLEMLCSMGYSDSVIYPDLEGLALEIKKRFGFGG